MTASVEQNSAGILSLWHCIFAVSAKKDVEGTPTEEKIQAMVDIYRQMRHLRSAIHGINNNNPDFTDDIAKIAKPFNSMFSEMSKEKWIEEFCSMMGEVVHMRDVLKDIKQSTDRSKCSSSTTLYDVENDNKSKNIISLLTLWYWLAVWSSPGQVENGGAKDEFMDAIEAHDKTLGFLLVNMNSPINNEGKQEIQILFSKLLQMLKSDHQFWMDVLDQFIDNMLVSTR